MKNDWKYSNDFEAYEYNIQRICRWWYHLLFGFVLYGMFGKRKRWRCANRNSSNENFTITYHFKLIMLLLCVFFSLHTNLSSLLSSFFSDTFFYFFFSFSLFHTPAPHTHIHSHIHTHNSLYDVNLENPFLSIFFQISCKEKNFGERVRSIELCVEWLEIVCKAAPTYSSSQKK